MSARTGVFAALTAVTALLVLSGPALAAPCPLPNCVPVPVPVPTPPIPVLPSAQPQPFATATPSPGVTPSPAVSPVPGTAPAAGQIPTDFGIQAMTHWVYNGGSWLAPKLYPLLTAPAGRTEWFGPLYQHMENIGFLLLLLFTVLGLGSAILRKDLVLLVKVPCWYGPISMFVTALAITFTQLLSAIVDGFSLYMLQAGPGDNLSTLLSRTATILAAAGAGIAFGGLESFVVFMAALALIGGLLLALLELAARQIAMYACLLFIPVTIVCLVWPPLVRIAKLMLEVLVGLIVLKLIIAAVLALAAAFLTADPTVLGPLGDPGFVTIVMGAIVVLAAVLGGPFFLSRAIPFAEHQAAAHWTAQPRRMGGRMGLTNVRAMHTAALKKWGSQETREKLAQGGRTQLILPQGSTVFVRSPKELPPQGRRSGGRRRP
jgi:hypothetical protein